MITQRVVLLHFKDHNYYNSSLVKLLKYFKILNEWKCRTHFPKVFSSIFRIMFIRMHIMYSKYKKNNKYSLPVYIIRISDWTTLSKIK